MRGSLGRVSAVMALGLAASAITAFTATPAMAAPVGTCKTVTGTATFAPGLTNTPANNTITAKGNETGCTPPASTGGSGVLTATIKVPGGSCGKLATGKQKLSGTATSVWKNKKTSKYTLTFTTGTGATATTATITGKVASGLFAGKKITGAVKFTINGKPDCATAPGIKSVSFKQTKPFVIA
jgi:hypothetical protein